MNPLFYTQACDHLCALDPRWAAHIERTGPCLHQPLPTRDPYQALVRSIAYQQLHAKAAEAILRRFLALYPDTDFPSPAQLLASPPGTPARLRLFGAQAGDDPGYRPGTPGRPGTRP